MTDVVADLQLGLKELGAEDRDGWGTAALSGRLGDLVGLHERTQVELLRTIALWDRRAAWGDDGAVTAVSWLKAQLDMAPGEAAAWVRLARVADEFPAILLALEGGEITLAKLRVLVRARAGREDPFAACVDGLVRLAGELPLADLTQVLAEWAELTAGPDTRAPDLDELLRPFADGRADALLRQRRHHPDGRRASRAFVAALLCTGWLRRVIVDPATGRPLDVGRAHRRFTRRQFRALVIRDGGCMFPGCDRPPRWCDAHHLHEWEHGGPTDLDNGVLLCRRHHVLVHRRGWHLARDPRTGIVTASAPDGRRFTRPPRPPCRAGP